MALWLVAGISYPPPFPNGWYKVADSEKLKKGDLKSVKACGLDLVGTLVQYSGCLVYVCLLLHANNVWSSVPNG